MKTKLHIGLTYENNGVKFTSFQLLNEQDQGIANANFEDAKFVGGNNIDALSAQDVALFHADCRNALLGSNYWADLLEESRARTIGKLSCPECGELSVDCDCESLSRCCGTRFDKDYRICPTCKDQV